MRHYTSVALVAAFAVLMCAVVAPAADSKKAAIGEAALAFSLQDQSGNTVSLADQKGKVVVLEWFNEGCPIVQRHYKNGDMNKLASKWGEKGVVWLAINSTKGRTNDTNKAAASAWKMDRLILNDASGEVGHAYGATNTPHMFIIDQQGKLAYMGGIDDDAQGNKTEKVNYVDKALTELMAGTAISTPQTKAYGCDVKYAK
jgi:peroxiredoxin